MATSLGLHDALIWVMVTASLADRKVKDVELDQIERLVQRLPVFSGFEGDVPSIIEGCAAHLGEPDGLDAILDQVAEALPTRLQETAYALAVEVSASDLDAAQEELRFLQMMEDRFELPKLHVAAIEHSARIRFRVAA